MTVVYFDSSAFVKLLVEEDGSDLAATLWDGCDAAVASRLAYPEVCAALAAAARNHRLLADELQRAQTLWEQFWAATRAVELTDQVADLAGTLAARHALRGADAVHLASAQALNIDDMIFAAWDERLRTGAGDIGFRVAPTTPAD